MLDFIGWTIVVTLLLLTWGLILWGIVCILDQICIHLAGMKLRSICSLRATRSSSKTGKEDDHER